MLRRGGAVVALLLAVSACGADPNAPRSGGAPWAQRSPEPGAATFTTTAGPVVAGTGIKGPPPYRLRYGSREMALMPHSWCYNTNCVDGGVKRPPSVGSPSAIRVYVPVNGWDLVATFRSAHQPCGRWQTVRPTKRDGWYNLKPAGYAGRYDVDLASKGGGGSMAATFRWNTPTDGALPTPHARLALLSALGGQVDSYGVELMLENLAKTPRVVQAQISVTAANGRSMTVRAHRSGRRCLPEGTVYFDGPDAKGKAAALLGPPPFHYVVTVTLGGRPYRASADYPADQIPGNEPSVALTFSPALPALR